jgi:hypothetical protein
MPSYCIDIAEDAFPFQATVTTSTGQTVVVTGSSSAYEAARAALATAWLIEHGQLRDLPAYSEPTEEDD